MDRVKQANVPQLSGATVQAAMELDGITREQKMCLHQWLKR
jgi:hypothetical protein